MVHVCVAFAGELLRHAVAGTETPVRCGVRDIADAMRVQGVV